MKTVTLGNLLLSSQYGTNEAPNPDGNIDVIGMKNIVDGKIDARNLSKVQMSDKEISDYLLSRGDILINRTNSIDLVGKTGIYDSDETAVFASYLVRLKPDLQKINPYYLNYWLNGQDAQKTIKRIVTKAVSQANINPTELKKHCSVMLPSLEGQAKIVEILQSVDVTIQTTERLIAAKERYFDGLLQKLLSYLNSNNSEIALQTLMIGDILKEFSRKTTINNQHILLSVTKNGICSQDEHFNKQIASSNNIGYKIVERNNVVFSTMNLWMGSLDILKQYDVGIVSPAYKTFEINTTLANIDFMQFFLKSPYMLNLYDLYSGQGASIVRRNLDLQGLLTSTIKIPSLEHQAKIAEVLNTAKREIDLLKKLAESYRLQKRGLMQKLLSGEWRVAA